MPTMAPPDTNCGKRLPMPETKGLSAMRTGYLKSSRSGRTPLARAVTTYGFFSSSNKLARIMRIMLAVPPTPSTTTGTQMCCNRSATLPQVHSGWAPY